MCEDNSGAIDFKEFCTKLFKKDVDFNYESIKDHQVRLREMLRRVGMRGEDEGIGAPQHKQRLILRSGHRPTNHIAQMSAQLAKAKAKAKVDAERAVVRNAEQLQQLLRTRATASEANGQLAFKRFAKKAQARARTHTTQPTKPKPV